MKGVEGPGGYGGGPGIDVVDRARVMGLRLGLGHSREGGLGG